MASALLQKKKSRQLSFSKKSAPDHLKKLDSKDVETDYEVEMLMLDGYVLKNMEPLVPLTF